MPSTDRPPPIARSYRVSPQLLAGAYPGSTDRQEALEKWAPWSALASPSSWT